jgi:hypothetical protein
VKWRALAVIAFVLSWPVLWTAASEIVSRRVWRTCDGSSGKSATTLRSEVEGARLLSPSCRLDSVTLHCEWKTLVVRWGCCSLVENGITAGACGSG